MQAKPAKPTAMVTWGKRGRVRISQASLAITAKHTQAEQAGGQEAASAVV